MLHSPSPPPTPRDVHTPLQCAGSEHGVRYLTPLCLFQHLVLLSLSLKNLVSTVSHMSCLVAMSPSQTKDDAIRELIKKGGYHGTITESLLNRIEVTRFQSSEKESCYQKYLDYYRNLRLTDVVHLEPEEKEEETEGHAADITGSRKANGRR